MIAALLLATQPVAACVDERIALAEIADAIEREYVLPEKARRAAQRLREQSESGALDQHCDDPEAFAKALTTHLRTDMQDDHLYVEYAPNSSAAGDDDWLEKWRAGAPARGFGVQKVERMPGNIAYLHLTDFYDLDMMKAPLAAAFELVASSDGLILDLRDNHGGSPETEGPVQWSFMAAGSPVPLRRESRTGPESDPEEPQIEWKRYGRERPLAILINRNTVSAPEAVAYSLQAQGRAVVIGAPSGGAANMLGDGIAVSGGWKIGVPESRPFNPLTGTNWERSGVIPDMAADDSHAIATARQWLSRQLESKKGGFRTGSRP
tara:strand:+ start:18192 stop:19157 length:966 start_codon:yes stop_codon:yes gene_type:complete